MLYAVTWENAHLFGDILPKILKLRYVSFKERQDYNCFELNRMEFDRYDTPGTTYITSCDDYGNVIGVARLNSTERPYMLKEVWGNQIKYDLPENSHIWEGSRLAVDKNQFPADRDRVIGELVAGYAEYCSHWGISGIVGTMPHIIWKRVFDRNGWSAQYISEPLVFGRGEPESIPGLLPFSQEVLENIYKKIGKRGPLLRYEPIQYFHQQREYA